MSEKYCLTSSNLARYIELANMETPMFGPSIRFAKDMTSAEIDALIREFQAPVEREAVLAAFALDRGKMGWLLTRTSAYGKGKKELFSFRFDSIDHLTLDGANMVIVNPDHKRIPIRVGKHAKHMAWTLDSIRRSLKSEAESIEYREEKARREAEETAKNTQKPTIFPFRRSDEFGPDMISVHVEDRDRRAAARTAFESALVLCLSREKFLVNNSPFIQNLIPLLTEDGLDLWSLGEWICLAEECSHPRAPYLRWLKDGTLPCHLVEAGPLFQGLQKHWDGDLEGAHAAFARAVMAGDREAMLCYAFSLCHDCGTVADLMQAQDLIQRYRNTPPCPLDAVVECRPILLDETIKVQQANVQIYNQFVGTYNRVIGFINEGRARAEKDCQELAARSFASAHQFAPTWVGVTYEYGMALQYQDAVAGQQLVYEAAKAGYVPAIRTYVNHWRPSDSRMTNHGYCTMLKLLLRFDPDTATPKAKSYRERHGIYTHNTLKLDSMDRGSRIKTIPIIPYERKAWVEKVSAGNRIQFAGTTYTVLERQGSRLLLLCDYVYPSFPYHTDKSDVTWQDCALRERLNTTFIAQHLSKEEQAMVLTVTNQNHRYFCGNRRDPETQDRVFVLSEEEARRYFGMRDYYTANKLQGYADDLGRANPVESLVSDTEIWLDAVTKEFSHVLRTRSDEPDRVLSIHNGRLDPYEAKVDSFIGARPAMWILVE